MNSAPPCREILFIHLFCQREYPTLCIGLMTLGAIECSFFLFPESLFLVKKVCLIKQTELVLLEHTVDAIVVVSYFCVLTVNGDIFKYDFMFRVSQWRSRFDLPKQHLEPLCIRQHARDALCSAAFWVALVPSFTKRFFIWSFLEDDSAYRRVECFINLIPIYDGISACLYTRACKCLIFSCLLIMPPTDTFADMSTVAVNALFQWMSIRTGKSSKWKLNSLYSINFIKYFVFVTGLTQ